MAHLDALCFGRTPRPVLDAYAAGLHGLDGWLHSLGGATERFDPPPARLAAPFPSWPYLPGGHDIGYRVVAGGTGRRGQALWDLLTAAVRERGIEVRYQTAAGRLALGPDGTVTGLTASNGVSLDAPGGVVLACGGFEADPALAAAYLPLGPSWPVGHPGNDGTGLRLAQQAGAALWHMYGCFGWFAFRTPDFAAPFAVDFFAPSHLFVDADGRLYAIETWPGIAGTTGGPQHDEWAQVLRPDGQPVPGLYAAGAVSLVWGHLIEHGGGLTNALVFGQLAGANAAARAAAPPAAQPPAARPQAVQVPR